MVATKKAILTCVVLVGILLYGCGCDAPVTPTPTPGSPSTSTATAEGNIGGDGSTAVATNSLPSGPAALLLNKATDAMHEAKSFQYMIVGSMYPGDATPTADEMQNTDVSQFPSERPLTEEEIERLIKVMGPTLLYTGEGAYVSPDRARYKVTPNLPPEVNTSDYEFPIIVVGDRIFLYNSFENHYMVYMVENSGGDFLDFALRECLES